MGVGSRGAFPGAARARTLFLPAARSVGLAFPVRWGGGRKPAGSNASALQGCAGLPLAGEAETSCTPSASPTFGEPWGGAGPWDLGPSPPPVTIALFPQVLPQVQAAP